MEVIPGFALQLPRGFIPLEDEWESIGDDDEPLRPGQLLLLDLIGLGSFHDDDLVLGY